MRPTRSGRPRGRRAPRAPEVKRRSASGAAGRPAERDARHKRSGAERGAARKGRRGRARRKATPEGRGNHARTAAEAAEESAAVRGAPPPREAQPRPEDRAGWGCAGKPSGPEAAVVDF